MKRSALEILQKVADLLDQIPDGGLLQEHIIPDDDDRALTDYTLGKLVRSYREFEKDPVMARIYGSFLRADMALALTDHSWRQRSQWRDWFMGNYLINRWWTPDMVTMPDGRRFRPTQPQNWLPLGEPEED
jgi:hypothetical protein